MAQNEPDKALILNLRINSAHLVLDDLTYMFVCLSVLLSSEPDVRGEHHGDKLLQGTGTGVYHLIYMLRIGGREGEGETIKSREKKGSEERRKRLEREEEGGRKDKREMGEEEGEWDIISVFLPRH